MPSFNQTFGFKRSPFEQYVAENEPDILNYAVRPPYFEVAKERSLTPSTHLLFGARGAGKSATRLATEKEIWRQLGDGAKVPLVIPLVDFSSLIESKPVSSVATEDLVSLVAFQAIETIFLWMTDEKEGTDLIEALNEDELNKLVALTKAFYLSRPEGGRQVSQQEAMKLLQQNWRSQTIPPPQGSLRHL